MVAQGEVRFVLLRSVPQASPGQVDDWVAGHCAVVDAAPPSDAPDVTSGGAERVESAGDVGVGRLPVGYRQADRAPPVDRGAAQPCLAAGEYAMKDPVRGGVVGESEEDLVDHDVVQHLAAGHGGDTLGERLGVCAGPLHKVGYPWRPRERSAAYTAKPRARRENAGVQSIGSRGSPGPPWTR
jgi:hypothetical protein